MNEEDDDVNDDYNDDGNQDMVAEYWSSDHHKFDWSGYMENLDPLSWHSLGLGIPESFLSKGNNNSNRNSAHNCEDHTMKILFDPQLKYVNFMYSHHTSIIYRFIIDSRKCQFPVGVIPQLVQYCTSIAEVRVQVPSTTT